MSTTEPNWYRYLLSLAEELRSQSQRVRNLIGDSHWLSDGHHKEYLLKALLQRYLPSGIRASRGFVVSSYEPGVRSREQDILIVDTTREAPVFCTEDLLITFPDNVVAGISVKTTMDSKTIGDSVKGLGTLRRTLIDHADCRKVWCGAYFYEVSETIARSPTRVYDYLVRAIQENPMQAPVVAPTHPHPCAPDLISSATHFAFRVDHGYQSDSQTQVRARIMGFQCAGLGTAFFLANLLAHIAATRGEASLGFEEFADTARIEPLREPSRELASDLG